MVSDPRPDQAVFAGVLMVATRMQRRYDTVLPELTLKQWLTLVLLRNLGGDASSVARIAELTGTTHQNTTKMIGLLARDGWIERSPSDGDRRARRVTLTPRTHSYFGTHEPLGEELLAELFVGVPEADLAATARTLAAMQANLDEAS